MVIEFRVAFAIDIGLPTLTLIGTNSGSVLELLLRCWGGDTGICGRGPHGSLVSTLLIEAKPCVPDQIFVVFFRASCVGRSCSRDGVGVMCRGNSRQATAHSFLSVPELPLPTSPEPLHDRTEMSSSYT